MKKSYSFYWLGLIVIGLMGVELQSSQGKGITFADGTKISRGKIREICSKGLPLTGELQEKVSNSNLKGKVTFEPSATPRVDINQFHRGNLGWNVAPNRHDKGFSITDISLYVNPHRWFSPEGLEASVLHERAHMQSLDPLYNHYYDKYNRNKEKAVAAALLVMALRKSRGAPFPFKTTLVCSGAVGLGVHEVLRFKNLLVRREQERAANEYMIRHGTLATSKGAIQQFAYEAVYAGLDEASYEKQLRNKYPYLPVSFIKKYVAVKRELISDRDTYETQLKDISRLLGPKLTKIEKSQLIDAVKLAANDKDFVKRNGEAYRLADSEVRAVVSKTNKGCLGAIS